MGVHGPCAVLRIGQRVLRHCGNQPRPLIARVLGGQHLGRLVPQLRRAVAELDAEHDVGLAHHPVIAAIIGQQPSAHDVDYRYVLLDVETRSIDTRPPHRESAERVLLVADLRLLKIAARAAARIYIDTPQKTIVEQLRHVEASHDLSGQRSVLWLLGRDDPQPDQQTPDVDRRESGADAREMRGVVDHATRLRVVGAVEGAFVEKIDGGKRRKNLRDVRVVRRVVNECQLVRDVVGGDAASNVPERHVRVSRVCPGEARRRLGNAVDEIPRVARSLGVDVALFRRSDRRLRGGWDSAGRRRRRRLLSFRAG